MLKIKKVEAWLTSNGVLFSLEQEDLAKQHEQSLIKETKREEILLKNGEWIINLIFNDLKDSLVDNTKKEDIRFYHMGKFGHKCKSEKNPIDICVYSENTYENEDMCVFCGDPDERK